jgi:catechol 2,3-dioxygenase-like lactoylglutathione lyase family enzyme
MASRPRLIGINHVALEVGDLDEALAFYGELFEFTLRGRVPGMAFLDMGDQFLALSEGRSQDPDDARHFGLVVDDLDAARATLGERGIHIRPGRGLDFDDPWGNHLQLVAYGDIQFAKVPAALRALAASDLEKTSQAQAEMREKGLLD